MTRLSIIIGAFLMATPALAEAGQDAPKPAPDSFDLARARIAQCAGERFDFEVAGEAGAKGTKVGLCSIAGASKDQIAVMLESAISQLEAADRMSREIRDQLIAQIRAKLVEVRAR